jgi:hypothetical protein
VRHCTSLLCRHACVDPNYMLKMRVSSQTCGMILPEACGMILPEACGMVLPEACGMVLPEACGMILKNGVTSRL